MTAYESITFALARRIAKLRGRILRDKQELKELEKRLTIRMRVLKKYP